MMGGMASKIHWFNKDVDCNIELLYQNDYPQHAIKRFIPCVLKKTLWPALDDIHLQKN